MGKLTANGRFSWGNGQGKAPALTLPSGQKVVLCPCMVSQIAVSWRGVRCFWHVVRFGSAPALCWEASSKRAVW